MPRRTSPFQGLMSDAGLPGGIPPDLAIRYSTPSRFGFASELLPSAEKGIGLAKELSTTPDLTASLPTIISSLKKSAKQPSPLQEEYMKAKIDKLRSYSPGKDIKYDFLKDQFDKSDRDYLQALEFGTKGDMDPDVVEGFKSKKTAAFEALDDYVKGTLERITTTKPPTKFQEFFGGGPKEVEQFKVKKKTPTAPVTPAIDNSERQMHQKNYDSVKDRTDPAGKAIAKRIKELYPYVQ